VNLYGSLSRGHNIFLKGLKGARTKKSCEPFYHQISFDIMTQRSHVCWNHVTWPVLILTLKHRFKTKYWIFIHFFII